MMLSFNESYYTAQGYGAEVMAYFTDYTLLGIIFWLGNLLCGIIAPLLWLLKNAAACKVAFASFGFDLLLILWDAIFRNRFAVFDIGIICFDIFILLLTLMYALYLRRKFI